MDGGPSRTSDPRLDDLERAVRALESRVAALESAAVDTRVDLGDALDLTPIVADAAASFDLVSTLTLVGRTLVVLGGAYLLRALTEAAIWPPALGITLAFAYAGVWLVAADRTGTGRRRLSGIFHGATAVMIAIPLLWEAVTRFHTIAPPLASVVLTATTLAALAVAVRRRLQTIAWIAVVGALAASLALTAVAGGLIAFSVADIVLGVATLWIGYTVDWVWMRWPVALVTDLTVLALPVAVSTHTIASAPALIVATELLLVAGYLVSVAVRTLVRARDVNAFEALQSTAALAVGFGGAAYVARATGTAGLLLVAIALAGGIASYAVAFAFIMRRDGVRRNFFFYTSVAIVLVIAGSALGLPEPAIWWAALAVGCAWLAQPEFARPTEARAGTLLTVHAATYLFAAALTSGLLSAVVRALSGAAVSQSPVAPRLLVVFAAACACWVLRPRTGAAAIEAHGSLARAPIALLVAVAAAGWLAALGLSDGTAPGVAATVRTGTLAATALALALIGRRTPLIEAAWLVYPLLVVGAMKLLVEDFPRSSAATLFVALALYGGALIVAPRLVRKPRGPHERQEGADIHQAHSVS